MTIHGETSYAETIGEPEWKSLEKGVIQERLSGSL